MRNLLAFALLLAGCAHERPAQPSAASFNSPGMERCLQYWTANYSPYPVNHFYVHATETDQGDLVRALVYWRESGRILDYLEEPKGAEAMAWRLRPMVDRDALLSDEHVGVSNDLVPHRVWVRWMKECISNGKEYTVTLKAAKAAFPNAQAPDVTR